MNPQTEPVQWVKVKDEFSALGWIRWLDRSFLCAVGWGTALFEKLPKWERDEFTELVNDGGASDTMINMMLVCKYHRFDLPHSIVAEARTFGRLKPGKQLPHKDRERLMILENTILFPIMIEEAVKQQMEREKNGKPKAIELSRPMQVQEWATVFDEGRQATGRRLKRLKADEDAQCENKKSWMVNLARVPAAKVEFCRVKLKKPR